MSEKRSIPTILHVDMDAFFASVEMLENPNLRGKPVIVGSEGRRGVVASCSYEARFYGVRSAMPSTKAKQLCPHAIFVSGRHEVYAHYSEQMHEIFQSFTPLVEGISLDEAFLDVSGAVRLFGQPSSIAWQVRELIFDRLQLHASVGVATTKHLAKLASVTAKPKASRQGPISGDGVVVINPDQELVYLHALPVRALWGVGPALNKKLKYLGIETVGQLANFRLESLRKTLGAAAANHLHELAWNNDHRPVVPHRESKSIGHEQTYLYDLIKRSDVHQQFLRLADAVASRLRAQHVCGKTVSIKVRFGNFETLTRSVTLTNPTADARTILTEAEALSASLDIEQGVRLLGISLSNLMHESASISEQLELGIGGNAAEENLQSRLIADVVGEVRDKFGDAAIVPAPLLPNGGVGGILRGGDQQWGGGRSRDRDTD